MREEDYLYLKKYYEKARQSYFFDKKKEIKSLFFELLKIKNNVRYNILNHASRKEDYFSKNIITNLLKEGLIRPTDKINNYVITAKGIWKIEYKNKDIDLETLLNFIDDKYFNLFGGNKNLNDKEKVMLLFMIVSRAFSEDAPINLKKRGNSKDEIGTIINSSFLLLKKYSVITNLTEKKLFNLKGNEHPVSDFIRHKEALVRKTNGLYRTLRDQKYCLDLMINDHFKVQELAYLLWLVFGTKINNQLQEDFLKLSESIYQKSIFIYSSGDFSFFNPKYDDEIKNALDEYLINLKMWNSAKM
ncbi:MAG: hypothetical protein ACTSUT_06360 [Promethearchaeota archaeon]